MNNLARRQCRAWPADREWLLTAGKVFPNATMKLVNQNESDETLKSPLLSSRIMSVVSVRDVKQMLPASLFGAISPEWDEDGIAKQRPLP